MRRSDDLGFVAQLGDELGDVRDLAAALPLRRLDDLERRSGAASTSTPSAAGLVVSSGFFFAFMMFGSVA